MGLIKEPKQPTKPWYHRGVVGKLTSLNRNNRLSKIIKACKIDSESKILDVGCGPDGRSIPDLIENCYSITGVDLYPEEHQKYAHPKFTYIRRDASDLSIFNSNHFDVGLNFGMMEHINEPLRTQILNEMFRVCKIVAILVPHRFATIESHFKLPLFSQYPLEVQIALTRTFNLCNNNNRSYSETKERLINNFHWLSSKEWQAYFIKSKCYRIYSGPLLLSNLIVYQTIDR